MPSTNSLSEDYATLGLDHNATLDEVKQAYRDLAKVWHPDRFSEEDTRLRRKAEEELKEINVAYRRIQDAQSQHQRQSVSKVREAALKDEVDAVTAFILAVNLQALNLTVLVGLVSTSREEIERDLKEFSANTREAVERMEALIRQFEREMPEYPRIELESILSKLSKQELEVAEAVSDYDHIQSEPYQEAREPRPTWSPSADTPSFVDHANHKKVKWIWGILCLLGAAGLCLIMVRRSSISSQPAINSSTSTSSAAVGIRPSASVEQPHSAHPSRSAIADDKSGTQDEHDAQMTVDENAVRETVEAWANAFRARDVDRLADYYAPTVEQFFRKKNVSRSWIHDSLQSAFGKTDSINAYEISDLRVEFLDGTSSIPRATATYNKNWDTSQMNGKRFSGEEVERLTFEKTDKGWKIVREDELQIIRVSRGDVAADRSPNNSAIVDDDSAIVDDVARVSIYLSECNNGKMESFICDVRRLHRLRASGKSLAAIGKECQLSKTTVARLLSESPSASSSQ